MTDAELDAYLPLPPGELRLALRSVLRHAFQVAATDATDAFLTALELWARRELARTAG